VPGPATGPHNQRMGIVHSVPAYRNISIDLPRGRLLARSVIFGGQGGAVW
jgi:hypothetical protein